MDGHARCGQHAVADPAHELHERERAVQPGAAGTGRHRAPRRRVRPVLLRRGFVRPAARAARQSRALRTTRSACQWMPRRVRRSPSGRSSSPTRFSATAGVRYTEETKGLQATMFNVSPATAAGTAGAYGAVPVCGPAADADRLPVPHHQPLRARSSPRRRHRRACSTASIRASMTYLSWSEGFKSGGFNQRYNAAPPGNAPISFDDETRRDRGSSASRPIRRRACA